MTSLGGAYVKVDDRKNALSCFDRALAIVRPLGDLYSEADTLVWRGELLERVGDNQEALNSFFRALTIARSFGDRGAESACLNDIALSYEEAGELEKALEIYTQALALQRAVGDKRREAITLNNAGRIHGLLGDWRKALVADGALQIVPFAALPEPGKATSLIASHEVVSLPSASVLEALRAHPKTRTCPKVLAVMADPVFDRDDQRVAGRRGTSLTAASAASTASASAESALTRSVRDLGGGGSSLPRLAFTRREAQAIEALVPPSKRRIALDFEASRSAATREDLSAFRFVHFATHGILDTVHPELSGLVFSLVDRRGRNQEGFLPAMEVFNLRLPVELVVLSACQTGLGKEIRGEGIVGLPRAFMYAGAPRVIASLWRVDDAATAELMKRFYEGMLGERKLRPAAALREAQLSVSRQKRWAHPYYWAGFVLQGEWR